MHIFFFFGGEATALQNPENTPFMTFTVHPDLRILKNLLLKIYQQLCGTKYLYTKYAVIYQYANLSESSL